MENKDIRRLKIILLVSSLVSLALLALAAFEENLTGEWRRHQSEYQSALLARADSEAARDVAASLPVAFQQVYLPELERIDRCVSCHVSAEDPNMADAEVPLRKHSGDLLAHHPIEKFGCTVCHEGQGRAVEREAAHGEVAHWERPLLRGQAVYRSCGKCHYENDLFGSEDDLFAGEGRTNPILKAELEAAVQGAASIAEGKRLVSRSGCLGCHAYRGRGGALGPEITHTGEKGVHDFDFTHVEGERTVAQWLFEHFKKPQEVIPGTLMPDMKLADEEARQLSEYILGLRKKGAPASHTPLPPRRPSEPASGTQLYGLFCASCHGEKGEGSTVRDPEMIGLFDQPDELMVPSLNNPDTLAVASDDYLRHIVGHGRSGTNMIAWGGEGGGGLQPEEIDRLVNHIRSWQEKPAPLESIASRRGNARFGKALYTTRCLSCHGENGEGGIGVALNSPSFLAVTSDDFLARTILHGRRNTAMPSWPHLKADETSDLLAFIRTWEHEPPRKETTLARLVAEATPSASSLSLGSALFRSNCATCHGDNGEGAIGPSLRTDEFLSLADDEYLFDAIVRGRPGTAMPSWRHLSEDNVADLIQYMRSWNEGRHRKLEPYSARGDQERGQRIFVGSCAGCHGVFAEGGVGPQLSNPVFLSSVSDAMLKEWISYGKIGTPMPAFRLGQQGVTELSEAEIEDVVTFLRRFEVEPSPVVSRPGIGIPSRGADVYAGACASCHGPNGEGGTGSALSNPDFLRTASDGFLLATIALGRDNTEMRAMGKGGQGVVELSAEEISNVVAFIRYWEASPPIVGIPKRYVLETKADSAQGELLFSQYCSGCHGGNGNDGWAPALNNPEFLSAATDGFLQATIARGRMNTAMWSFGKGAGGVVELEGEQINNIVAFIRSWDKKSAAPTKQEEEPLLVSEAGKDTQASVE